MRQIKFRGRVPVSDKDGGKIVYGQLIVYDGLWYTHWLYTPAASEPNYPVEPSSIAQLVTVIDGVEIYEGDTIERDGKKYRVTLEAAYHAAD